MRASLSAFSGVAVMLAFVAIGCSSSSTNGPLADAGPADAADDTCKSAYPRSQTLSQPCCTGWGADACGALLFCAAFDGRTQTTCYPDGARKGGETCAANSWCASRECAPDGKCRSVVGEMCDQATGCAAIASELYGCTNGSCKRCDANATDPRCPAACKGHDSGWSSDPCRLCESSACCTQLAACTSDEASCASKASTMLACKPFRSCLTVFDNVPNATSAALKQCFSNALAACASVCP